MNNHRLYIIIFLSYILVSSTATFECDERSQQGDIPFARKVEESPVIVIGTSLNKNIYKNIRNLFNVTFLVECVLKGRPTERIIYIVQAGSLLGRRSCQKLDVNRQYIVFLEPFFDGTYRPADFDEVPYSAKINIVLEKTCGLARTYPFTEVNDAEATVTNRCPPAISVDCPSETSRATVAKSTTTSTLTKRTTTYLSGQNSIDLVALSLLLAEHQRDNLSLAFLQDQNHDLLFSDDDVRKNFANQLAYIHLIYWSVFSILSLTL